MGARIIIAMEGGFRRRPTINIYDDRGSLVFLGEYDRMFNTLHAWTFLRADGQYRVLTSHYDYDALRVICNAMKWPVMSMDSYGELVSSLSAESEAAA